MIHLFRKHYLIFIDLQLFSLMSRLYTQIRYYNDADGVLA